MGLDGSFLRASGNSLGPIGRCVLNPKKHWGPEPRHNAKRRPCGPASDNSKLLFLFENFGCGGRMVMSTSHLDVHFASVSG